VLVLTEILTVAAKELLGIDPFLKVVAATAIVFMSFALVGLATGMGARSRGSTPMRRRWLDRMAAWRS
jgi:hypothetical protein